VRRLLCRLLDWHRWHTTSDDHDGLVVHYGFCGACGERQLYGVSGHPGPDTLALFPWLGFLDRYETGPPR